MRTMVPLRSIIRKGSATFHGCEKRGVYRIHVSHTPPPRGGATRAQHAVQPLITRI
jgi:hypothetical protein